MARPVKWRRIEHLPSVLEFKPATAPADLQANILKVEELEAIRLKDLEGLEQTACARQMEISRPTFQRILLAAREKVADSLINGKAIQIEGGHYTRNICPVRCLNCGQAWSESLENIEKGGKDGQTCPNCHSDRLQCCPDDDSAIGEYCRRRCRRRGQKSI